MNFLFIKVMRRNATAQYAAEYDMFETVLFLETMATTFCRLRPEALYRHDLPLQLRLLPTTMELLDAVASLVCRRLCHDTRVCARSSRELLPGAAESLKMETREWACSMARRKLSLSVISQLSCTRENRGMVYGVKIRCDKKRMPEPNVTCQLGHPGHAFLKS
jgi:hypothetical protein